MCSAHSITNPVGQISSNRAPSWRTSGSASAAAALARSSQSRRCSPSTPSLLGSRTWEPPAPVRRWSHHHVRPVAVSSKGIQAPDRRPRPQPAPTSETHGPRCPAGSRTAVGSGSRSRTTVSSGSRRRCTSAVSMENGLRISCCVPRGTELAVFQTGGQTVWFLCADSARRTSLPHTASSRVSCVVCAASSTDVPQASGARSTSLSVCCEQHRCVTGITCPQHQHLPAALSTHDHRTEA